MNPDTGRIHATMEALRAAESAAKGERVDEVEAALERAERKRAEREVRSSVPQGAEIPPDWPRFEVGERVGPIKGWWYRLVDVDLEAQRLLIEPLEPTKSTKERRVGKRKRGKTGTRRKRKRGFHKGKAGRR
jgi:hypothetical protein